MGVEGWTKCIKYILFFFNFFFWLTGCGLLAIGLWLRHDKKTDSLLTQNLAGIETPHTFYIGLYILMGVGAVMMFVGFLGCYGAIQESQCLLGTFFTCLVILFACSVAAGIWGYINKDKVSKELIGFYDSMYDIATSMNNEKKQDAAKALKVFHETLECCGKDGLTSAVLTTFNNVCPTSAFTQVSCHSKIREVFNEKLYLLGIIALAVAVVMIFEMIFSMVLCCVIRNSPVY